MYPTVSVVINTLNRSEELKRTLDSFRWIKYPGEFEIIVVNGPSSDDSDRVISAHLPAIRAGKCELANLSVSRNIGICMARGDIVAFIDDDAIPEPEWLTQLVSPYADSIIGAAGGFVFDHTGYDFQYRYCLVDRFGNADLSQQSATPHLSFPKSYRFPHLLGCNSSFRRSVLLEVRGFDEEYEYFLDETDLCLRIVDAGYMIAQLPGAYVHHKLAASNIRGSNRVPTVRYAILKNKLYFMLKHAREFHSLECVLEEYRGFVQSHRNDVALGVKAHLLSDADEARFVTDIERAYEVGLRHGLDGEAKDAFITQEKQKKHSGDFVAFNPTRAASYKVIVIVSRNFPPDHGGGVATLSRDLAEALAAQGNIVHVIAQSNDVNRVDLENGVWVHRIIIKPFPPTLEASIRQIPEHIWSWSNTALTEVKRIATHRTIDVIEAPISDCEGVAFLLDRIWPLITSLHTTLHSHLDFHPERRQDKHWMATVGDPMLVLEKELITMSSAIRANSRAIIDAIQGSYGLSFDSSATRIIPHGIGQRDPSSPREDNSRVEVLFVGRLEKRKGIDVLLRAIPKVINAAPHTRFRIVGEENVEDIEAGTYQNRFVADNGGSLCVDSTLFVGRLDGADVHEAYAGCDIFVAPSRFESSGLVFLEAMRAAKPVIGCTAGGIPEIVDDGVNGILVEPGNSEALASAMLRLVQDSKLREAMGAAGRRRFEEQFTSRRMARDSISLFELAKLRHDRKPQ
jgi:glycosyltransferase involved in cell wall biosynthesis